MTILTTLQDEMKTAMKARDQRRLDSLRLLVSAIKYAEVDSPNLTDEQIAVVLQKEAKKRREAIEAYHGAGREESAQQEEYELLMIADYLPAMMSEEEVRAKVGEILDKEQGISNIGQAMKMVMGQLKGKAEGSTVSKIVSEILLPASNG